jgi:hypothetical protein
MKKRLNDKLSLNRETLGTLTQLDLTGARGAGSRFCTTETSNPTLTDTCIGPSCAAGTTGATGTNASSCC